jgi:hypothetical protein
MSNIRSIDMLFLDDVFDMGGGYVLNFSDRTFACCLRRAGHMQCRERLGGLLRYYHQEAA